MRGGCGQCAGTQVARLRVGGRRRSRWSRARSFVSSAPGWAAASVPKPPRSVRIVPGNKQATVSWVKPLERRQPDHAVRDRRVPRRGRRSGSTSSSRPPRRRSIVGLEERSTLHVQGRGQERGGLEQVLRPVRAGDDRRARRRRGSRPRSRARAARRCRGTGARRQQRPARERVPGHADSRRAPEAAARVHVDRRRTR